MSRTRTILRFNKADVTTLLDHARNCERHGAAYDHLYDPRYRKDGKTPQKGHFPKPDEIDDSKIPWGLFLVADEGVYLMSNGEPRDIVSGNRSRVAYAEQCNPNTMESDALHDSKTAIMGGDDQSLFLPGDTIANAVLASRDSWVRLRVSSNGMYVTSVSVDVPKRP